MADNFLTQDDIKDLSKINPPAGGVKNYLTQEDFDDLPVVGQARAEENLKKFQSVDPDRAARILHFYKQTKETINPAYIDKHLDVYEKAEAAPTRENLEQMARLAPKTTKLMGDPVYAPVIRDKYSDMGNFESMFTQLADGYRKIRAQRELSGLLGKVMEEEKTGTTTGKYASAVSRAKRKMEEIGEPAGGFWQRPLRGVSEFAAQQVLSALGNPLEFAAGAGAGAAAGAWTGWGAVGTGITGGLLAVTASDSYKMERNLAYDDYRELTGSGGEKIDTAAARDMAERVGLINAALETLGETVLIGGVLKPAGKLAGAAIKGGGKAAGKAARAGTATMADLLGTGRIAAVLAKIPGAEKLAQIIMKSPASFEGMTVKEAFKAAGKNYLTTMGSETGQEYLQEVSTLTGGELLKKGADGNFDEKSLGEILGEAGAVITPTMRTMLIPGIIGAGSTFMNFRSQIQKATGEGADYKQIKTTFDELKLAERSPEYAKVVAQKISENTGLENVYVSKEGFERIAAEHEITPDMLAQELNIKEAYDEAQNSDKIKVGMGEWLVNAKAAEKKLGGGLADKFNDDITLNEESFSVNETKKYIKENAELAVKSVKEAVESGEIEEAQYEAARAYAKAQLNQVYKSEKFTDAQWQKSIESQAEVMGAMILQEARKRKQSVEDFTAGMDMPNIKTKLSARQAGNRAAAQKLYAGLKDFAPAPAPKTDLLKVLRREGANYAAAARIDKEVFKDKKIYDKKGGVGDGPAYWLRERGFMAFDDAELDYEALNDLNEQAFDLIQKALDGEQVLTLEEQAKTDAADPQMNLKEILDARTIKDFKKKYYKHTKAALGDRDALDVHYFLLRQAVDEGIEPPPQAFAIHRMKLEDLKKWTFEGAEATEGEGEILSQPAGGAQPAYSAGAVISRKAGNVEISAKIENDIPLPENGRVLASDIYEDKSGVYRLSVVEGENGERYGQAEIAVPSQNGYARFEEISVSEIEGKTALNKKLAKMYANANAEQDTLFQKAAEESIFKADEQTAQKFKNEVNRVVDDNKISTSTLIDMGSLPPVFKAVGLSEKQLKTNKFALLKAEGKAGKNPHKLSRKVIEELPALVADPIAIFKSLPDSENPSGYVAVLNARDKDGNQALAIISPSKDGKGYAFLPTAYGKSNFSNFVKKNLRQGMLLYKKNKDFEKAFAVQSGSSANQNPNNRIQTKEDIVKGYRQGPRDMTQTPAFKKWFGDSKVVDGEGRPLVVYHGQDVKRIEIFDNSKGERKRVNLKNVFFFTNDLETAETYSMEDYTTAAWLKIENPYIADFGGTDLARIGNRTVRPEVLAAEIKAEGKHDGIIMKNIKDASDYSIDTVADNYVVFSSNQIKHIDNRGTFEGNNIFYQGGKETEQKNLLMATAVKSPHLNEILKTNELIAPSFSITKKGQTELNEGNFGDLLFIRRPESIDFKKDNIYDGDIYSPRLPEPIYMLNGVAYNDTYGEPATKAIINNPKTRKVFFDGFTPMGSRRYKAYTAREIIKSFKKDGLVKGEGFNYGLSSFIAAFRNKLSTKKAVKQAGETKLSDREENKKHYNELSKKSDMLVEEFYPYLKHQDEGYATFYELLEEVNNKNEKGIEELARWDKVPRELKEKADKFTEYAKKLSVSYFEAKPLRAVALSEFGKVLAEKGKLTGEQKKKLQRQGIEIIEYTQGNIAAEIKKIEQEGDMYFQGENGGGEIPSQQLRGNDREGAAEGMTGKKEGTAGSGAGNEPRGIKGFFGDIKEEIKNLLQGKRGAYDPADNIIYMTPDSDASTMLHEFAHYFLKQRWEYILNGKADEAYIKDFAPIKEFLEIKDGQKELSAEQQEKFASAWEDYLATGEAPSAALKKAFERLKQWFLKIYGELRAKAGFELPKEVRAYFDAMLASEEEIKEMNEALTPQLEIKEKTEEEKKIAAFVKDAWDRAKRAAAQKLFARKQEAAEKIKPQEYLDEEARFEEQRYNELVEEKGYRASEALGELTEKDPKELAREYVDEGKISAEDYATAELTAKAHGFDGVDNLLGWIRVSPTFRERLQSDVEEYMAKWEGEHLKAGDLENNLDIAGDDAYLEAMAAEYLAIKNAQEKTKFNLEAARALAQRARVLAKEILAGMPAKRAARLNAYWRLMGKFNAQARAAYGRKDYAKAREHKNAALINAALGREAARIKKQFEKDLAYLKNLAHRPKERFKNQSAFNQIGYVLSRLGIKLKGYNAENGRENISEWAARLSEKNGEADIYITELINEQTYNWTWDLNRIKAADLDEFISTLKSMVRATNAEDRMGKDFEYAKVSDTAARLEKVLRETVSDETRAKNAEKIQARARRMVDVPAKWVSMITRTLTLLKIADGNKDGGLFEQIFYTPVKRAQDRQDVYLRAFQREYRELVEGTYTREELREIANKVSYQEPLGGSLTKAQIIAMALNTGNEMNKERLYNNPIFEYRPLKDGPAWGESVVWDILNANMGKKDWEFVQAAWDMINKPWEEVAQMEERVSGFRPQKVEAAPFMANTADGQTVYLRGGYYPLKYDGRSSETLASREVDSGALAREMKAAIQQTKHGHTERRAQNPGYPLSLNMDIIGQHMAQVYHDLAFREVIISLRKLLNNATAINAIKNNLGPDAYQLLKKYVADAAVDEVNIHANTPVATMVNWLRKNATIAGLCLRLSVVLQNLANVGILPGAVDGFGPQQTWATALKAKSFVLDLAFDGASARELREFVYGKSPMMQSRAEKGFDFTMRQLKQTKLFENNQKLLEFGNAAMVFTDNVWAVPAWQVAYEQGLEMYGYFDAAKTEAQMSEAEQKAIDRADKLIANTIGTGRKIDASQFTRSSDTMTRALNMFYSFMEVMANRWLGETNAVINQKDYARFLGFAGAQLIVFVTMSELLSGRAPEKWEPKEILKWYTAALVDYTSGMVPILRDVAPYFADKVLGNPTYGYSPSPLISSAENIMIRPLEAMLGKKTSAQNVGESITRAAAYALPYPDQFNGLFWNAYDMTINGMTPRLSDLYRRRPKKERK